MTISNTIRRPGNHGMLDTVRRRIGGRRGLWLVAGLALAAGLALKWDWLVAAGVAPVIVSLLPCAAMCALGFCAHKIGTATPPGNDEPGGDRSS